MFPSLESDRSACNHRKFVDIGEQIFIEISLVTFKMNTPFRTPILKLDIYWNFFTYVQNEYQIS